MLGEDGQVSKGRKWCDYLNHIDGVVQCKYGLYPNDFAGRKNTEAIRKQLEGDKTSLLYLLPAKDSEAGRYLPAIGELRQVFARYDRLALAIDLLGQHMVQNYWSSTEGDDSRPVFTVRPTGEVFVQMKNTIKPDLYHARSVCAF